MSVDMSTRSFDGRDDVSLYATSDANGTHTFGSYHDEVQSYLRDKARERDMRALGFGERASLCG